MPVTNHQDHKTAALLSVPQLLDRNKAKYGDRVAMRKKFLGIWQEHTWGQVYDHVRRIALGFVALGARKGDRMIVIGNNDPELVWAQWGAQHAQLVVSCLYVDYLPEEVKYFIEDCQPKFMVCEDQEQVDKIIRIREACPSVEKVIYWDPKGLWSYDEPYLMSLEELERVGQEIDEKHPEVFQNRANAIQPSDLAVLIYTSGTTGNPKGNMQTYRSILEYAGESGTPLGIQPWDEYVSYASPAWAEQMVGLAFSPVYPIILSFPEEPETVMADIRDIGPHFLWFPGRQWEDLARKIQVGIDESSWWKRSLFKWAMAVSFKRLAYIEKEKPCPFFLKMLHRLLDFLVLRKVRDYFGMNRARCCGCGGALTSPDLSRWFTALGLPFASLYGTVEAGMLATTPPGGTAYASIGLVNPGKQLKIEDKQIWVKVGEERPGYWNRPGVWEATLKDGWQPTGDAGWVDENGYYYYIDRISEMSRLKSGHIFSPQLVETKLRFNSYIKDAIVFGADEDYITAIISCDFGMVGRWAESQHLPYTTLVELSQLPPVMELIGQQIHKVNEGLAREDRVMRFVNLHKEFDPDEAELTRSRKIKRSAVGEKYRKLIEAMYQGRTEVSIETEVTYKDGRKAKTTTMLKVNSVHGPTEQLEPGKA
jgi:long-chain acyl-CoA synthetase